MSRTGRPLLAVVLASLWMAAAACGGGSGNPDAVTTCSDGLDNDGDTLADYPADPGCDDANDTDESNAPIAQCLDGRDNDGDGLTDFPYDPGCFSELANSEMDDCPDGPGCPQCSNDLDDDGDTFADFPQDDGCSSAGDNDEYVTNPAACGNGLIVTRLLSPDVTGMLVSGGVSDLNGSCGGAGDEAAYELVLTRPTVIVATTDKPATTGNTVLYLRDDCMMPATEMACNDDIVTTTNLKSTITASVPAGVYYLIVDAQSSAALTYALHVDLLAGEGVTCASTDECGPGLVCRVPHGETEMVCSDPVCSDGRDDDDDGTGDYPGDPGCDGPADADETDDCPSGPNCPACANDLDDDGDTFIDYPADTDCSAASQPVEGCATEQDPILLLTSGTMTGDLTTLHNDFALTCGGGGGNDTVYFAVLPAMSTITFDTIGTAFDTVLGLYGATCTGSIDCNDDAVGLQSRITRTNVAAGAYALVVAAYSSGLGGPYTLHTTGTIAPGGRCDGALAASGAITCGAGFTCGASGVCIGTDACDNGVDDDADGDVDYPADPGCTTPTDTDETDDCPSGPTCPACSNNLDDDGDGATDYPADAACLSASGTTEACLSSEPVTVATLPMLAGTTTGASNDYEPTCGGIGGAPDLTYQLDLPTTTTLTITTEPNSYDAMIALLGPSCGGAPVACSDTPEATTQTNLAAGRYYFVVDGYGAGYYGTFQLGISGRIANNEFCDSTPLAMSGALTCADGYACQGTPGMGRCLPAACGDAIDADGDGFPGYPSDPGCTSISDPDETDDCPSGPNCPECSDDVDNDGDGATDYPADTSCSSAAGAFELGCAAESDPIVTITAPTTNGTTTGATGDFIATCQSNSAGPDVSYQLVLPVALSTLTLDTNNSGLDTVLTFREGSCTAAPIACDDDTGTPGNESLITTTNVAAGAYIITVDGYASAVGPHQLHVNGVAVPDAACTSALFTAGVLHCASGQTCMAGTCQ